MSERAATTLDELQESLAKGDIAQARRALLSLSEAQEEQLREELGPEGVDRVKRQARRVTRGAKRGRVVVVHGIMGALLDVIDAKGDVDRIWVNYLRLAAGRIADLELGADEQPRKPGIRVQTAGLERGTYLPLLLELDREWDVLPFAFDWREDIDRSADHLADAIQRFAAGKPVHLVAHSMGGLVARCMIQRHPDVWAKLADPEKLASGGRLVMLGTPNHGSFAIPLMLCGEEFLVRALALADQAHDKGALLKILSTFPGSYQMLPSPFVDLGDAHGELYEPARWGKLSVRAALIAKAERFHRKLRDVVDPERFVFVAGYNQPTPVEIRIPAPGKFEFKRTHDGDGRVPHALGLLHGVRTLWIEEKHGDLPKNERVLGGIHELLASGTTSALELTPPIRRRAPEEAQWVPASEIDAQPALPAARGSRGAAGELSEAQQRAFERMLLRDYGGSPAESAAPHREAGTAPTRRPKLKIEVVWGDITKAEGDAYAVGHYQGVLPQRAELALDKVVSPSERRLVITEHTRRGTLRGALGDVNYFKWSDPRHCERVVAVAGMGRPGSFGIGSLRRLVRELVVAVSSLPNVKTVCSVLIGSGKGTLSLSEAVLGLVDGIVEALTQDSVSAQIETLRIVEGDRDRAREIQRELAERLAALKHVLDVGEPGLVVGPGGTISNEEAERVWLEESRHALGAKAPLALRKAAKQVLAGIGDAALEARVESAILDGGAASAPRRSQEIPTRISALDDGAVIRVAAITQTTTVAERTTSFDLQRVNEIAALINDSNVDLREGWPSLLLQLLLPRDFRDHVESADALVFEVDRFTARIHWEVVARRLSSGLARNAHTGLGAALALQVPVARQLRTTYSAPPTPAAQSSPGRLRALVIGDPGAGAHSLPGARREALAVKALLETAGVEVRALIGAPSHRAGLPSGSEAASWLATMEALGEPWDIVHYCGHGDFDPKDPSRVGWVFENGLLTAGDIRHLDSAPGLVVANACLSARTSSAVASEDARLRWSREAGLLPSLADEFFKLGVRNYVGASWEVDDLGAVEFADRFYGGVLSGESVGAALLATRKLLWERRRNHGKLWAAYQHYGDPAASLAAPLGAVPSGGAAPKRRRARPNKK